MTLSISFPSFTPGTTIFSAQVNTNNGEIVNWANTHEAATTAVHGVSGTIVGTSDTQTLTNKTLTQPLLSGAGAGKATLQYANSANNRTITFDDPGGNDSVVYLAATQTLTNKSISTSQINSGTFADARIAQSNVTQHQAALTILETQITDGTLLARVGSNETITGAWTFPSTDPPTANTATRQSLCKSYGSIDNTGSLNSGSYNVSSSSKSSTGNYQVNLDLDFSASGFSAQGNPRTSKFAIAVQTHAGSGDKILVSLLDPSTLLAADADFTFSAFGDQ